MFVGKRKIPRRAVDLEGTWARRTGGGGEELKAPADGLGLELRGKEARLAYKTGWGGRR